MASLELSMQQVKKRVIDLSVYLQSNGQDDESRLIKHAVTHQSKRARSSSVKSIVNSNRDSRTTTVFFFVDAYLEQTSIDNRYIMIIIDSGYVIQN